MLFFHPSRFGWVLVLALGLRPLVAPATQADYSHDVPIRLAQVSTTGSVRPCRLVLFMVFS
jgi:hypothetical protein